MNGTLFRKELKSGILLCLIFLGVLTMYGIMIVMMFEPSLGESLRQMAESMPELFAAFGMAEVGDTLVEFVANYLYGMLFVVFPAVYIVITANRLVAKYVDNGSMAYLLATPHKRRTIIFTQALYLYLSVGIMVLYLVALIVLAGGILFPGELDIPAFLRVNYGLLGMLIFFSGVCFWASCSRKEARSSYVSGTAVVVYTVLLQMISQVGEKFEMLKYLTPLSLFDVNGLIEGTSIAMVMPLLLYLTGIAFTGAGIFQFCRRDLSL